MTLPRAKACSHVRSWVFHYFLPVGNECCPPQSLIHVTYKMVTMTTLHQKFTINSKICQASAMCMISLEAWDVEIIYNQTYL